MPGFFLRQYFIYPFHGSRHIFFCKASPDSKTILYQGFDTTDMETFHIADSTKPENEPDSWPYPRAGKVNAQVWLEIAQSNGSTSDAPLIVTWDAENYPYLAHVKWAKQESGPGTLVILVQNREQTAEQIADAILGSAS